MSVQKRRHVRTHPHLPLCPSLSHSFSPTISLSFSRSLSLSLTLSLSLCLSLSLACSVYLSLSVSASLSPSLTCSVSVSVSVCLSVCLSVSLSLSLSPSLAAPLSFSLSLSDPAFSLSLCSFSFFSLSHACARERVKHLPTFALPFSTRREQGTGRGALTLHPYPHRSPLTLPFWSRCRQRNDRLLRVPPAHGQEVRGDGSAAGDTTRLQVTKRGGKGNEGGGEGNRREGE